MVARVFYHGVVGTPQVPPKPPVWVGCTPVALASAICACVKPGTLPVPGHVSLLIRTVPPSSPGVERQQLDLWPPPVHFEAPASR